ncbi:MAG: HD domain-containing protein [Erysipelotrichaceae bacterium]|nr:HD domain-containing protein [Erysipelotrichaceae bacterium]
MEIKKKENALIEEAIAFAKDFFKGDFSGHDFYHTLRVYRLAMNIAEREECDRLIVALAALLHDVDDYKLVKDQKEPYENARGFLKKHGFDEDTVSGIIHIIEQVSFKGSDSAVPDSIEGMIVQDADRLDAIGAIGIARTFAYGGSHDQPIYDPEISVIENMNGEQYLSHEGTTVNHFHEKLLLLKDMMNTRAARELAENRHKVMEDFLAEFYDEWDGIR